MKKFACIFIALYFLNILNSEAKSDYAYTLKIVPDTLKVSLEFRPFCPDSSVFHYGYSFYGGMKDLMKSMVNFHTSSKFVIDSTESKITIYHKNQSSVNIKYDIIDTHKPEHKVVGEMFRPIVTKDYFFSLSHTLFLIPDLDDKILDSLSMSVTLMKNPTFPMYFSFSPDLIPGDTAHITVAEGQSAYVTGASDLMIVKKEMSGIKNYIILRINEHNKYNYDRFMNYFNKYMPAMTEFWGNLNGTYYTMAAVPFIDIKYHNISGTAFGHGFHIKFAGDTILANKETIITISHEIMHRYIGTGCVSLGEENQWFNEGFTDYTTWLLLSEAGIITKEEFNAQVEDTYEKLLINSVRNTPNSEIRKHFWENHDYEKLPYNRGALFAAYIDKRLNELSKETYKYKDFMRNLKKIAESKQSGLTTEDFINCAKIVIPPDELKLALEKYIILGEMIPKELIMKDN